MVAPIDTSALVDLLGVPIDTRGVEFALGIAFSVPVALVLGLLVGLIAWLFSSDPLCSGASGLARGLASLPGWSAPWFRGWWRTPMIARGMPLITSLFP